MPMTINVNCKREIGTVWIDKQWLSGVRGHGDETNKSEDALLVRNENLRGRREEEIRVEQRRPPSESPNLFGLSSWYMSDTKYIFINQKRRALFFCCLDWWIFRAKTQDTQDTRTQTHTNAQEAFCSSFFPLLYLKMSNFWEKIKGPFTVASVTITILFITYSSQIFVIWPFLGAANMHSIAILVPLNFFVLMALINYFLTCKTDPGSVPNRWVSSLCSLWKESYD